MTTRRRKERVKEYLKPEFQIPEEEVPDGIDKSSTYFNGAALNLPSGWLIELLPRPGGKRQDQVAYPWTEMMKKRGKRKRTNELQSDEPEPLPQPHPLTELQPKHEPQAQPQPQLQHEPEPYDCYNTLVSIVWYLESAEENRWIPELPNAEQYRSQWWEVSSFTTSNPNPNQFFYEPVTGKQFRPLKEVLKHLGSSSNKSTIERCADAMANPWTEMMRKRGKRKRTNEPRPPQQPEIQHEPEPHAQPRPPTELQPEAEQQVQPQPQHESGPELFARNSPPMSVIWCLQSGGEIRWIPEVPNAVHYRSQWWEPSGFTTSNRNTDQAGGSGQAWRR